MRAGLSAEEVERVQQGADAPGWESVDADVLRATEELHTHSRILSGTWGRLAARFDTAQLMDLVFLVGCYDVLAMAIQTFQTQLEPGVAPLDPVVRARMPQP
jgi:4-carboxymuconolactone decarboxylase